MELYFDPEFDEENPLLNKEESHHCIRVKRKIVGDMISIANGKGAIYQGLIHSLAGKRVHVTSLTKQTFPSSLTLRVFISPPKSSDRLEWVVEKLTELGVTSIHFIHTQYSERKKVNIDRLRKKAISALKQSNNPFLPHLEDIHSLDIALKDLSGEHWIAHIDESMTPSSPVASPEMNLFIGPEGGFTKSEFQLAIDQGCKPMRLGTYILRTETASMVGATLLLNA